LYKTVTALSYQKFLVAKSPPVGPCTCPHAYARKFMTVDVITNSIATMYRKVMDGAQQT